MLKCPTCGSVYENENQLFCLNDGTELIKADYVSEPTVYYQKSGNQPSYQVPTPLTPAKKSNTLLILSGVGALMLILFFGVMIFVGVILSYKNGKTIANAANTTTNTNTSNTQTQPTPVTLVSNADRYVPELKMAINSANNAQTTAYASLNAATLNNYYSGEALKSFTKDVETMKAAKIYQVSTMPAQNFEEFKVNDAGTAAEVKVTETWESYVYQIKNKKCLAYYPPTRTPQTVYLKKAANGWMIDSTVYEPGIKKNPQACPKGR